MLVLNGFENTLLKTTDASERVYPLLLFPLPRLLWLIIPDELLIGEETTLEWTCSPAGAHRCCRLVLRLIVPSFRCAPSRV